MRRQRVRSWSFRFWSMVGLILGIVLAGSAVAGPLSTPAHADPNDNGVVGPASARGAAGPAVPVPISTVWNEFLFGAAGTFATGCSPTTCSGPGANSVFVGAPPWTFTGPAQLQVTDAFLIGDRFEIFDNNVSIGLTSVPGTSGSCGPDPDPCFASAATSHGSFNLGPGAHSITIRVAASPFSSGAAYFRVIAPPTTCDLTVTHSGGTTSLGLNVVAPVATTFNLYLIIGNNVSTLLSVPLPANTPVVISPPISFPFPPLGGVGWLVTLTTPTGGIICADFVVVNTGSPPASGPASAPRVPSISIPLP